MTCFVLLLSTAFGSDELFAPAVTRRESEHETAMTMHELHNVIKFVWQDFESHHEDLTQTAIVDPEELVGRRRVEDMSPAELVVAIPQAIEQYALATYGTDLAG